MHLKPGDRVFLSPHFVADERTADPAQILIGHTATGSSRFAGVAPASRRLQELWPDGVFAEKAHLPAAVATPLPEVNDALAAQLAALAKAVVPYGGLQRGRVEPGHIVIVNGATGYYGSAGVLVALAMGAARVVAAGRNAKALAALAERLGPRVVPAVVGGEVDADTRTLAGAAGRPADVALDLLGQAQSTATTLAVLRALGRGGRLVLMGSAAVPLPVTFGDMLSNDWEIIGNFMYRKDAPRQLAALAAAGLLDLAPIPITRFPLAEVPEAIRHAATMRGLDMTVVEPQAG